MPHVTACYTYPPATRLLYACYTHHASRTRLLPARWRGAHRASSGSLSHVAALVGCRQVWLMLQVAGLIGATRLAALLCQMQMSVDQSQENHVQHRQRLRRLFVEIREELRVLLTYLSQAPPPPLSIARPASAPSLESAMDATRLPAVVAAPTRAAAASEPVSMLSPAGFHPSPQPPPPTPPPPPLAEDDLAPLGASPRYEKGFMRCGSLIAPPSAASAVSPSGARGYDTSFGVTLRALQFLTESTRTVCDLVLEQGELGRGAEELLLSAESARAGAVMIEDMLDRTSRRRSLRAKQQPCS